MQTFDFPTKNKETILALGAESAGNFSVSFPLPLCTQRGRCPAGQRGFIYFSKDFGDLLNENNFNNFKKSILDFLKREKIKPDIIISDLHPLMKTTLWGKELSKKYKAQFIQVQHHHAHVFSAIGEQLSQDTRYKIQDTKKDKVSLAIAKQFYGVALDGTGYGTDEKIWGGEVFEISNIQYQIPNKITKSKLQNKNIQIERIGHLENQIMIGGELAIQEPARMLIAILAKISNNKFPISNKSQKSNLKNQKNFIYGFVKKYYTKNEFELLYNQLKQNFNCIETSSTGRILDAVSLLLGFCGNERKYKHEAIDLLEKNYTKPYSNLKPRIDISESNSISNSQFSIPNKFPMTKFSNKYHTLNTTYLFEYLINNLHKDKKRLAATAQLYIAQGLHEIIKKHSNYPLPCTQGRTGKGFRKNPETFLSGGLANNKIISNYFNSKNIYLNKKIPRGDAGLSFGQIVYFLLNK